MTIDPTSFRDALGRFATGITVVTGLTSEGDPVGVTVSAFSSLSLDPPLVLFCLGKASSVAAAFTQGEGFTVNILESGQERISNLFAGRDPDKFAKVDFYKGMDGRPVLEGCIANIECRLENVVDGGDHHIVVGRVEGMKTGDGAPLLYFRGRYGV